MGKKMKKESAKPQPKKLQKSAGKAHLSKFARNKVGTAQDRKLKIYILKDKLERMLEAQFPPSWAAKPSQRELAEACRKHFGPKVMNPDKYGFGSASALSKFLYESACALWTPAGHVPSDDLEAAGVTSKAEGSPRGSMQSTIDHAEELMAALSWNGPAVSLGPEHSRLHAQLVQLASISTLDGWALETRRDALVRVVELVRESYPTSRLEIFGSR